MIVFSFVCVCVLVCVRLLKAVMNTLSIGASLLLPPLRERTELLHTPLPQGPESWASLSTGHVQTPDLALPYFTSIRPVALLSEGVRAPCSPSSVCSWTWC